MEMSRGLGFGRIAVLIAAIIIGLAGEALTSYLF
jgi:hypothetical protein